MITSTERTALEKTDGRQFDPEIIRRCKAGDRVAFRCVVERYTQYARALCFHLLGDADDVTDAVQEAFIKAWMHIDEFEDRAKFSTWFYCIVVNVCRDALRRRRRARGLFNHFPDGSIPGEYAGSEDVIQTIADKDLVEKIRSIVQHLPEKQRLSFILRDLQELSVEETAVILAVSENSVKTNLCYARRAVRAGLERLESKEHQ